MKSHCPIKFEGIDHVVLYVTDSERTLRFYTQVLGLTVERIHGVRVFADLGVIWLEEPVTAS